MMFDTAQIISVVADFAAGVAPVAVFCGLVTWCIRTIVRVVSGKGELM